MQLPTLYQRTANGSINYWKVWADSYWVCSEWGQVGTKSPMRQKYAAEPTNEGRANFRDAAAQACFEAESLWKKKKRLKYFEKMETAARSTNIKPMLAQLYMDRYNKGVIKFPVTVQPKFNGLRCFAFKDKDGDVLLLSRGGKYYQLRHISEELEQLLPDNYILDGELYCHGRSLQGINSLVKKPRYPESEEITLHVYDSVQTGLPDSAWEHRMADLSFQFESGFLRGAVNCVSVPNATATSHEEVISYHNLFVADGYEGAIIRLWDAPYRFGHRSPGLLKYKILKDAEFRIVGWDVGKDGILIWKVVQEEGKVFEVRPMGTEEERMEMLAVADKQIGKLLTVRYQDRTQDNIPTFGRGVAIRDEADL